MPENNSGNHRRNGHRTVTIRNYVAKNQWQRGGVHDKPNKAKRQKAKQQSLYCALSLGLLFCFRYNDDYELFSTYAAFH